MGLQRIVGFYEVMSLINLRNRGTLVVFVQDSLATYRYFLFLLAAFCTQLFQFVDRCLS
jgi:hypothetical protein